MTKIPTATELFIDNLRTKCAAVGIEFDKYDPDYILGVMMVWLGEHDAVLTSSGVEKRDS